MMSAMSSPARTKTGRGRSKKAPGSPVKGCHMNKPCRFYILPGMRVRVVFEDDTSIVMTIQELKENYGESI
jgi:hypothetical protein